MLVFRKNFPTPEYLGGGHPTNWIEVGASSWKGGDSLAATFSNYGACVDISAPGTATEAASIGTTTRARATGTSTSTTVWNRRR